MAWTRRRVRHVYGVGLGLLACVCAVAGCTSADDGPEPRPSEPKRDRTVAATEACPGLIGDTSGEALTRVLQSSSLIRDDGQAVGAARMAASLMDAYRGGAEVRQRPVERCAVTGVVGSGTRSGEIQAGADSRKTTAAPGSGQAGVRTSGGDRERGVAFDCVSLRVGSTRDVPLRVHVVFKDRWTDSAGDAALGGDYLVIAHSAARALAGELGCEGDGGLPDRAERLPAP